MSATLYIIGVGPGDPDLLTVKALTLLRQCPIIATPTASLKGHSTALAIVRQALSAKEMQEKEIVELHFPMQKIHRDQEPEAEVLQAWQEAAQKIVAKLRQGKSVAFPTLGDPAIYSTGYYLYMTITEIYPQAGVRFVPGISAMSSCSANTSAPLCLGDDMLAVIPATFSDKRLRQVLESFDTIVLMKVHKVMDTLIPLLHDLHLIENAILVERVGMTDERVMSDLTVFLGKERQVQQVHYFSTIIVKKRDSFVNVYENQLPLSRQS
jgi:precorrin-2/cobalt-factor-2 C20-methyltransferase